MNPWKWIKLGVALIAEGINIARDLRRPVERDPKKRDENWQKECDEREKELRRGK